MGAFGHQRAENGVKIWLNWILQKHTFLYIFVKYLICAFLGAYMLHIICPASGNVTVLGKIYLVALCGYPYRPVQRTKLHAKPFFYLIFSIDHTYAKYLT